MEAHLGQINSDQLTVAGERDWQSPSDVAAESPSLASLKPGSVLWPMTDTDAGATAAELPFVLPDENSAEFAIAVDAVEIAFPEIHEEDLPAPSFDEADLPAPLIHEFDLPADLIDLGLGDLLGLDLHGGGVPTLGELMRLAFQRAEAREAKAGNSKPADVMEPGFEVDARLFDVLDADAGAAPSPADLVIGEWAAGEFDGGGSLVGGVDNAGLALPAGGSIGAVDVNILL